MYLYLRRDRQRHCADGEAGAGIQERVGRLLIRLAEEAETVERIICGMGQKIK